MASFHLSNRAPILSSAWAGPSLRMDEDEYRTYKLIKATVKRQEEEKKQAEKKRRVMEGLPPCEFVFNLSGFMEDMEADRRSERRCGYQSEEELVEGDELLARCDGEE